MLLEDTLFKVGSQENQNLLVPPHFDTPRFGASESGGEVLALAALADRYAHQGGA